MCCCCSFRHTDGRIRIIRRARMQQFSVSFIASHSNKEADTSGSWSGHSQGPCLAFTFKVHSATASRRPCSCATGLRMSVSLSERMKSMRGLSHKLVSAAARSSMPLSETSLRAAFSSSDMAGSISATAGTFTRFPMATISSCWMSGVSLALSKCWRQCLAKILTLGTTSLQSQATCSAVSCFAFFVSASAMGPQNGLTGPSLVELHGECGERLLLGA
mmetsp:Transcript_123734/g.293921  ORF Transcript_123734/g.293921 Transcript_123734/m.293921 type:complete len:218 (-) Transcript_123734:23-676(-)